jgi:hypothetical protein
MVIDLEKFKLWLRRYACHVTDNARIFSAGFLRVAVDYAYISGIEYNTPEFQRFTRELWEAVRRLEEEGYLALVGATCSPKYLEKVEGFVGAECGTPPGDPYSAIVVIPREVLRCEELQEPRGGGRRVARRVGKTRLTEYL